MLTKITITVPDLGDNRKNLEVEGALAAGEKATVTLVGIPSGTTTDGTELRLRVLGPMGEDLATHGDWTVGTDGEYTTDIDLATLQAYRLFVPPPPPPPPPNVRPVPRGYPPVRPPFVGGVDVRLLVELRSDGDASMLGMRTRPLVYWPTDWKTATLIDLADGRVYSKEEVDALIAQEAQERANGDASTLASAKAHADTKYAKPAGGIPRSDLASDVRASLGKADTAIQQHQDISKKADLVDGKVPSSQLPSYVDDVLEYASRSAFPNPGEEGKIYVALDTNKTYRWTGTQYVQVGGGDAPVLSVNGKTGAVVLAASDVGAATVADATLADMYTWVFEDGFLEAAQAAAAGTPLATDSHVELGPSISELFDLSIFLVSNASSVREDFGNANLSEDGLSALYAGGLISWQPLEPVASRRSTVPTYHLGSQTDKPLAPAGDYALKSELGTAASKDVPTSGDAETTQVVMGDDSRLSDARTPTSHGYNTHAAGGTDEIDGSMLNVGGEGSYAATRINAAISDINTELAGKASASSLANVATSGDYNDLMNKPAIPTVPTNVSAFTNDAGYLTQHQDISGKLDAAQRNMLVYASTTTLSPATAVYRSALNADGTFPAITDTAIPTAAAYYQFELELTVPSTVPSTITGPSGWTFLDGHGLPDPADLSGGETICISVRLDCTARTFLASVWRVA